MISKQCPWCGEETEVTQPLCTHCKSKIGENPLSLEKNQRETVRLDVTQCPFCGEQIDRDSPNCVHCKSILPKSLHGNESVKPTIRNLSTQQKNAEISSLPIIISILIFSVIGYVAFTFFQDKQYSCDDKQVVSTLKKLYEERFGHGRVVFSGITTVEKNSNIRRCSALMDSTRCKESSVDYEVRIADNKREFTVYSMDKCAILEELEQLDREMKELNENLNRDLQQLRNLNRNLLQSN